MPIHLCHDMSFLVFFSFIFFFRCAFFGEDMTFFCFFLLSRWTWGSYSSHFHSHIFVFWFWLDFLVDFFSLLIVSRSIGTRERGFCASEIRAYAYYHGFEISDCCPDLFSTPTFLSLFFPHPAVISVTASAGKSALADFSQKIKAWRRLYFFSAQYWPYLGLLTALSRPVRTFRWGRASSDARAVVRV